MHWGMRPRLLTNRTPVSRYSTRCGPFLAIVRWCQDDFALFDAHMVLAINILLMLHGEM